MRHLFLASNTIESKLLCVGRNDFDLSLIKDEERVCFSEFNEIRDEGKKPHAAVVVSKIHSNRIFAMVRGLGSSVTGSAVSKKDSFTIISPTRDPTDGPQKLGHPRGGWRWRHG
jgi:hypothetical protein